MNYKLYIAGLALSLGLASGCDSYHNSELEQCLDREQKTTQQLKELSEKAENLVCMDKKEYQTQLKILNDANQELKRVNESQKQNYDTILQMKKELDSYRSKIIEADPYIQFGDFYQKARYLSVKYPSVYALVERDWREAGLGIKLENSN